ncbi:MAG: hypothetical protein LUC92_01640 [Clostridiales bacterium]|nr:hypothetical protein [Clostridiales bacterium]
MKKILSFLLVMTMMLSIFNITAFSGEAPNVALSFSTGSSGDVLTKDTGSDYYYLTTGSEATNFASYEALGGTICAALTDTSSNDTTALHIPFKAVSDGVISIETTMASNRYGVNLFKVLDSDGNTAVRCFLNPEGGISLITSSASSDTIGAESLVGEGSLTALKLTLDLKNNSAKLSLGSEETKTAFDAGNISEVVFETPKASLSTKIYVSAVDVYEGEEKENGLDPNLPTLYLLGDSTGSPYTSSDYYKNGGNYLEVRNGFGMAFPTYFDESKINLVNYAISGISSKSFLQNDYYKALLSNWKEGDYVIIAFGHNDEKNEDEARFTDASMGAEGINTEGQFANSLYANYIKPAQEAGVNVILATPISRRDRTTDYIGGSNVHNLTSKGFGDYAQTIRDLAEDLDVACIDNTQMTYNEYVALGKGATDGSSGCGVYHALYCDDYMTTKNLLNDDGSFDENYRIDNTHLNSYGAKTIAYFMAEAIKGTDTVLTGADCKPVYSESSEGTLSALSAYLKAYTDPRINGKTTDEVALDSLEGFSVYLETATTLHDELGEVFDVTVNVKDNPGLSKLSYAVSYDSDILRLVFPETDAEGSVLIEGNIDGENEYADGVLTTLSFEVIGGGDTDISVEVVNAEHNGSTYSSSDYSTGGLNIVCDFNPENKN